LLEAWACLPLAAGCFRHLFERGSEGRVRLIGPYGSGSPAKFIMARRPAYDYELTEVYIDETSQNAHRYLIIGALVIHKLHLPRFNRLVRRARKQQLPHGEMKWTKVSDAKLPTYKGVVDLFFDEGHCPPLEFHSIVVDTTKFKRIFSQGSREIGFSKEIYQLSMKVGRLYKTRLFHVFPDERRAGTPAEELRLILNRGMRKKGDQRDWPFRRVHFQDSKKHHALQIVDVLIGALAFRLNGHHLKKGASATKRELADHILARANIHDVFIDTAVAGKFTIWHRQLK
jgi:hypothetical protein